MLDIEIDVVFLLLGCTGVLGGVGRKHRGPGLVCKFTLCKLAGSSPVPGLPVPAQSSIELIWSFKFKNSEEEINVSLLSFFLQSDLANRLKSVATTTISFFLCDVITLPPF